MYVLIIGCGRTGSSLANLLSSRGEEVVVIDYDQSAFSRLSPEFTGFTIVGDATEIEVLKEAKLPKADLALITTDSDNVNAMVAQIASELYELPRVIVKIIQPEKEVIYDNLEVETLSQTNLLVETVDQKLSDWN